jgi:hypothetical protein
MNTLRRIKVFNQAIPFYPCRECEHITVQNSLAHKKAPTPLGTLKDPRHRLTEGS